MLGVASYFYGNRIKVKKLIVIVGSFFGFTPSTNKDFFKNCADEIIIFNSLEEFKKSYLPVDNSSKYKLISTSPYPYSVSSALKLKKISFNLIVIEEGIGTYGGNIQKIRAIWRETPSKNKTIKIKSFLKKTTALLIKKIIFYRIKKEYWLNFNKKNLSINKEVITGYKIALKKIKEKNTEIELKNPIVIITSPFVELGLVSPDKYINYLKKITEKTSKNIYIKPHPIENQEKYKTIGTIIKGSIPIEIILCNLPKETKLLSFSSTSLYTAKLFFNLNVIRLHEFDIFYNLLGNKQKKIIDSICKEKTTSI